LTIYYRKITTWFALFIAMFRLIFQLSTVGFNTHHLFAQGLSSRNILMMLLADLLISSPICPRNKHAVFLNFGFLAYKVSHLMIRRKRHHG
jgi:hypothetical protein